jgi:hypothetical protein
MAPAKKSTAKKKKKAPVSRWFQGDTPFDELEPSEQIAHTIVTQFRDLSPSVERVMNAELSPAQRLEAISLFQTSLDYLDDPNRDPRQAIESALSTTD